MIRAYLRRAWKVGRTYYFITLLTILIAMLFTITMLAFVIATANPEDIHGVNLPAEEAMAFVRASMPVILMGMVSLFVSMLSSLIVLGTIQADVQNGVFEVLFGNGVSDKELIKALYLVGLSSFAVFYLLAEIIAIVPLYIVAPNITYSLLAAMLLTPLGVGLFTTGLSILIGLNKPKYFKISTGIGSTKNLAFTLVSIPSLVILIITLIITSAIMPSAMSNFMAYLEQLNIELSVLSIIMALASILIAFKTPVNRIGLITRGEEVT